MCGIAGIARVTARPVSPAALAAMAEALAHRGPDGTGFHRTERVGLAHEPSRQSRRATSD